MWENVCLPQEPDGPLLFLDWELSLPFLKNAFALCGREFHLSCLLLDRLAALLLGGSPRRRVKRFLEQLPPPDGWERVAPQDRWLRELYQLALAEFERLENTYHVTNTAQLANFHEQEGSV